MDNKKLITILSIIVTIIIVIISAILIINENNKTTKSAVAQQNIEDNSTIEPTEISTEEPVEEISTPSTSPSPKTSPVPSVPKGTYYIKVNNQMNTVTIYTKDAEGNYTIPVKAMVCSTGYASPKNSKYQIKGRWTWGRMFGGVFTQWETLITDNILFHSVPYLKQYDYNSLEYWEYNKLGTTCSAGCIRLTAADALWIYNNCANGTWVEFYSSSNPGPLGKPVAPKIPTDSPYRGWDPTDPHPDNPWKNVTVDVPSPEPSPEPTPEVTPSVEPTLAPIPSIAPVDTPSATPSEEPSETPSATSIPQVSPTPENSSSPIVPTVTPTSV